MTTETDDLVMRLRREQCANPDVDAAILRFVDDALEAADTIERLQRELAAEKERSARLEQAVIIRGRVVYDLRVRLERDLRECVELLRKARAEMRRLAGTGDEDFDLLAEIDTALARLKEKP